VQPVGRMPRTKTRTRDEAEGREIKRKHQTVTYSTKQDSDNVQEYCLTGWRRNECGSRQLVRGNQCNTRTRESRYMGRSYKA
jgi:hypothetical protein